MSNKTPKSKDDYFQMLADISNEMVAAYGRDFAIGTLVLAARFVAEHAPQDTPSEGAAGDAGQDPASQGRAPQDRI